MKKIAILGCENSHANAFLKFINEKEEFADVEVVGVYSDDVDAANKLKETFGVAVMEGYGDAVGKIDGLVITARHGDNHFKYAKPYIDSGIPMFIDKPITVSESDAIAFMKTLKEKGVPVCGGSSLKQDELVMKLKAEAAAEEGGRTIGGFVRAPYQSENAYGGFFFYAQHLVEMVCEIFGRFPLAVAAKKSGKQISLLFRYGEYDCAGLMCDNNYFYYASRMAEKSANGAAISSTKDWYYREFKEFYGLLCGSGQTVSYEELASPVFIMNAIARAIESGKEEKISYPVF